jgi:hypothetical protein
LEKGNNSWDFNTVHNLTTPVVPILFYFFKSVDNVSLSYWGFWLSNYVMLIFVPSSIKQLPTSAEHSTSWEANSSSANQEILAVYGSQRFTALFTKQAVFHKWARWIQSHAIPSYFFNIHFNIILNFMPISS